MLKCLKQKLRNKLNKMVSEEVHRQVSQAKFELAQEQESQLPTIAQLVQYHNSQKTDRQSYYDHTKTPMDLGYYIRLKEELSLLGLPIEETDIDIYDFETWLRRFPEIDAFYSGAGDAYIEKCLEHYLSFKYLNLTPKDVYIDIASSDSPWPDILLSKGYNAYSLDLSYPKGIQGNKIGADAGNSELPDGFANVLSSQCGYECFMGESDVSFIKEADRILADKGRYALIPLYIEDTYFITTSPYCDQKEIIIDKGAKRVWRDDGYKVPFSRFYSPKAFIDRVYNQIPKIMTGKIIFFKNLPDIMNKYRGQKVYCYFMFYCSKN